MSEECKKLDREIKDLKDDLKDTSEPVEKARIKAKISELEDRKDELNCP